jgi:hypothetical protein
MKLHQILPTLLIAILVPEALDRGATPDGVMVFDIRKQPTVADKAIRDAISQGVPPWLSLATAMRESWLNPHPPGDGNNGDFGLFQLREKFHPGARLMSLDQNIHEGNKELARHIKHCRTTEGPAIRWAYTHGRCK